MPGALCADDEAAAGALVQRARELVHSHGADYLILRDSHVRWDLPDLMTDESQCTMVVPLNGNSEKVWQNVDRRARQLTNKARKAGLRTTVGIQAFDGFYPVFAKAMRDLGTPTLGRRFFMTTAAHLPENIELMAVRHDGETLGGGFMAPFRETVYCTWGGMLREHYSLNPNHLLFWETLRYGMDRGFDRVDLGRSQWDSGTFNFKKKWGAVAQPLYQQTYLNGRARAPRVGSSLEENARYRVFVRLWRLLPLAVTEFLGPQLRRRMPFG
jgi:FemAB-related protein (PEP-CTERM system-associated)